MTLKDKIIEEIYRYSPKYDSKTRIYTGRVVGGIERKLFGIVLWVEDYCEYVWKKPKLTNSSITELVDLLSYCRKNLKLETN